MNNKLTLSKPTDNNPSRYTARPVPQFYIDRAELLKSDRRAAAAREAIHNSYDHTSASLDALEAELSI